MKSITCYTLKEAYMKDKFVGIAKVGEKGQNLHSNLNGILLFYDLKW